MTLLLYQTAEMAGELIWGEGVKIFFYDAIDTVCFYTDGHVLGYTIEDVGETERNCWRI